MRDSDWMILSVLYETRNITKAANSLYLSQPTLTKRIRSMETEWGARIIQSSNKGITFTPLGEYLARAAKEEVCPLLARIHYDMEEQASGTVGTLKIGSPSSLIRFQLPKIIWAYKEKYPEVNFSVATCLSDSITKLVSEGHVQIGFLCGDYPYDENRFCIGKTQCYLVSNKPLDLNRLPEYPRIEYTKGYMTLELQEHWWKERFSTPMRVDYKVDRAEAAIEMVRLGLGYGFFSTNYNFASYPDLNIKPLYFMDGTPMTRNNWMIYEEKSMMFPLVRNFVEFIKNYVSNA